MYGRFRMKNAKHTPSFLPGPELLPVLEHAITNLLDSYHARDTLFTVISI